MKSKMTKIFLMKQKFFFYYTQFIYMTLAEVMKGIIMKKILMKGL